MFRYLPTFSNNVRIVPKLALIIIVVICTMFRPALLCPISLLNTSYPFKSECRGIANTPTRYA